MSAPEVVYQIRFASSGASSLRAWGHWMDSTEQEYLYQKTNPNPCVEARKLYTLPINPPLATNAELLALLPGTYYMDPPDGGAPSVLDQLQRMAEDARLLREYVAKLQTERRQLAARINNWRHEPRVYGDLRWQMIRIDMVLKELGR